MKRLDPIWHVAAQHSTAQHVSASHSTAQHSTAQHSTAQHSTAQHRTAQHVPASHSAATATATNLSEALDSCIDLLLWDANGAIKIAAGPNGAILCFVVHCADGGALQSTQTWLVQQLLCHLHESQRNANCMC